MIINPVRMKILMALLAAFVSVSFVAPEVFVADSPTLRTDAVLRIANLPLKVRNTFLGYYTNTVAVRSLEKKVADKPFIQVAEGVRAKTTETESLNYVNIQDMKVEPRQFTTTKGKTYTILVPVGQEPSQELLQSLESLE